MGTATAVDQCTTVGPILTNPILSLPPGRLSTWQPVNPYDDSGEAIFTVGQIWNDPKGGNIEWDIDFTEGIAPIDIKDLACPTWGLGFSTSDDGTVITTIGPPYLPIVIPPMDVFSLDPAWASACTGMYTDQAGETTLALFDPPIALTPAALLLPTPTAPAAPADPTTIPEQTSPSAKAAKPAPLPNDPAVPAKTGDPGRDSPTPSPDDPPSDPKVPSATGDPPAEPVAPSLGDPDPPLNDPHQSPSVSKVPTVPEPLPVEIPQAQTQGLGAFIFNVFGKSEPEIDESSPIPPPSQSIFTVGAQTITANPTGFIINNAAVIPGGSPHTLDGTTTSLDRSGVLTIGTSSISLTNPLSSTVLAVAGQTFTANPSAFSIAGTIISAGGPAVTIKGTAISLDQSGALAIGSSTIHLTDPSLAPFPTEAFTVAGQTFTPNPSAFSIAGTTISADGPAATIGGTIISLGHNGALQIGSSTISLRSPSDTSPSGGYTVAGQTFTPNPSAFVIAGTTISTDGPAVTVNGTIISLDPSGTLVIGSSTIPLLTSPVSSDMTIDGFDVQEHSSFVVVDGVTLSAAAPGVTISGTVVSLEAGGSTLDIGAGHFVLPTPTGAGNGAINVQAFTGGRTKTIGVSPSLLCAVCGITLMLLM